MSKKEIELQCDIAWAEKYLELTGHKIGDEVTCSFTSYSGNRDHAYSFSVIGKGTIVRTEKGIFVKSNDKVKKAHEEHVRGRKSTIWVYREEYDYANVKFIKEL